MDRRLAVMPGDRGLRWPDSHRAHADRSMQMSELSPPWLGSLSSYSTSISLCTSTSGFAHTDELSPISNDVETSPATADTSVSHLASPSQSPLSVAEPRSATSLSHTEEAWPVGYHYRGRIQTVARGLENNGTQQQDGFHQAHVSNEPSAVPKLEPLEDDDFRMDDVEEAPSTPIPVNTGLPPAPSGEPKLKRPRGRPRKHPLVPNVSTNKITKGRSKTGCLTCRKRKKKCDEAKPRCMNCEKNAVVCEGYPEKQIWKSGKERAEEERRKSINLPSITMYPLFSGLETVEDRIFWKHYNERLSIILTAEGDHANAFRELVIPLAVQHDGLMHSILALASKHIDFETPYGKNILRNNPGTTLEALRERSAHHCKEALSRFCRDVAATEEGRIDPADKTIVAARYGQMLCFFLEALIDDDSARRYRLHLNMYRKITSASPPRDSGYMSFIAEFFDYHIIADELVSSVFNPDACTPSKRLAPFPGDYKPRLLGITDGLLCYLSDITAMRNKIRSKMMAGADLAVDYGEIYPAVDIDAAIRGWTSQWPSGDSRAQVTLLYRQMMWIYLHRTVYIPSMSSPSSQGSSTSTLSAFPNLPPTTRPAPSAVNTPPHSASTSRASSPTLSVLAQGQPISDAAAPRRSWETSARINDSADDGSSSKPDAGSRAASPAPDRRPPNLDPTVIQAVEESLALLESFKPNDPCQRLLLLPCFLVGTACFSASQQRRMRTAVRTVRAYTGLRNADRVLDVLEEVWRLMQAGNWVAVWDWPSVVQGLGVDFIPA
ncbi:hypothetical protein VTJ83DRAFT_3144 [Remersonia thermophila]|uniref:Zn(2)-C6 fungal-type domain-containing protein n=1 Tax=Remersonia thermophila TaxID=72144 RepID=A0ABR4DD78_9PEZI